ncbi:hypothetical protein ABPG77_009399 [Micractinium sp. CCAP 211/92]
MLLQATQVSQLRLPGLPASGPARSRPLKALAGGRRARLPTASARRRLGCCAAAPSTGRSDDQEPRLPPLAPRQPNWLARAVGQAALLLPVAAISLGLLGPRSAAWAKPPLVSADALLWPWRPPRRGDDLIDESTGAAQPWLYSRGVWNQKQYGTIHRYYTDRKVPAAVGAQDAAPEAVPAAPATQHHVVPVTTAAGAAQQPARSAGATRGGASTAAGSTTGAGLGGINVAGAVSRMNQVGARVADALSGTNLADPQVQRSAAILVVTVAVLLMFANRGQQAQRRAAGAGASMGDSSTDSDGEGDERGAASGAARSAAAATVGVAAAPLLSLSQEQRQAEAARRIAAAKQRAEEAQQKQEGAAAAAVVEQGSEDAGAAAEPAVIADLEAIADAGSVAKFTTDAAAALAIAEATAETAAAAQAAEAAAAETAAAQAAAAEAAAAAAAAKEAEQQRQAAAALEAAAAEERRRQEEEAAAAEERRRQEAAAAAAEQRLRQEKEAVQRRAEALVQQQREAAQKLKAAAAEERQRQQAAAAGVRQPPPPAPIVGSSFGLDVGEVAGPAAVQPAVVSEPAVGQPAASSAASTPELVAASSTEQAAPSGGAFLGALGAFFKGLGGGGKTKAAAQRAAAGPGQQLAVGSVSGAGRQLEAASGRAVAGDVVGVAAGASRGRAALGTEARPGRGIDWGTVLLAPAAPLLAALPSRSEGGATGGNKYDMLLDVLSSAAAAPEVQGDSRYDPVRSLLKAAPATGVPRYDFARSLLRGMVADDVRSSNGAFDMAWGLLERVRSGEVAPTGPAAYDPVWWLLHEATLLQEWGDDKYNPLAGLEEWGPVPTGTRAKYCPWSDLVHAASEGRAASTRSDPLRNWLREFSAPTGSSRYCPVSELRALAGSDWQGPSGRSKYDMVAAALDAAAGWEAPQGRSPYDPMTDILDYEPPAAGSSPLSWLLNGWAGGWQYGGEEGGKYVPNLLAAIKGASPSAQRSKFDPISGEWTSPEHTEQVKAAVQSVADGLANGSRPAWDGSGVEGAAPRVRSGSADWS